MEKGRNLKNVLRKHVVIYGNLSYSKFNRLFKKNFKLFAYVLTVKWANTRRRHSICLLPIF